MYRIKRIIKTPTRKTWLADILIDIKRQEYEWVGTKEEAFKKLNTIKSILENTKIRFKNTTDVTKRFFIISQTPTSLGIKLKNCKNYLITFEIEERK